jgi:hypothetical protein
MGERESIQDSGPQSGHGWQDSPENRRGIGHCPALFTCSPVR